jgi:hypothetical protein
MGEKKDYFEIPNKNIRKERKASNLGENISVIVNNMQIYTLVTEL